MKTPNEIAVAVGPKLVEFLDTIEEIVGSHPTIAPYTWRSMPEDYNPVRCEVLMLGWGAALDRFEEKVIAAYESRRK